MSSQILLCSSATPVVVGGLQQGEGDLIKVGKLKRFKKVSSDLKTILKTDLANLRFLSFEKGEACQSILIMLRGKIGLSKPEVKKIGCV